MLALASSVLIAALAVPAPASGSLDALSAAAFERMKSLAGTWKAAMMTPDGEATTVRYRLTANGSALVETLFQGSPQEMVTVYHLDGGALALTHYCAAGNQPHLRLDPRASTKDDLRFVFAGGSNIDPKRDVHMHELTVRFHVDGTSDSEWVGWKDGKQDHVARIFLNQRAE